MHEWVHHDVGPLVRAVRYIGILIRSLEGLYRPVRARTQDAGRPVRQGLLNESWVGGLSSVEYGMLG